MRVVRHLEDTCQGQTEIVQQYLVSVVEGWGDESNGVGGGWSRVKWGVEWGGKSNGVGGGGGGGGGEGGGGGWGGVKGGGGGGWVKWSLCVCGC